MFISNPSIVVWTLAKDWSMSFLKDIIQLRKVKGTAQPKMTSVICELTDVLAVPSLEPLVQCPPAFLGICQPGNTCPYHYVVIASFLIELSMECSHFSSSSTHLCISFQSESITLHSIWRHSITLHFIYLETEYLEEMYCSLITCAHEWETYVALKFSIIIQEAAPCFSASLRWPWECLTTNNVMCLWGASLWSSSILLIYSPQPIILILSKARELSL